MALQKSSMAGYTLIEVLLVVAISALMVGGGIAAFIRYNDRQAVLTTALELQTYIRSAQQKAQVGDRPTGCDRLLGYQLTATATNPVVVTLTADCVTSDVVRQTITLRSGITLSQALNLRYAGLTGGFDAAQTVTLTSTSGYSYRFSVARGGEISEGAFQ